jgi:hypothetical protein
MKHLHIDYYFVRKHVIKAPLFQSHAWLLQAVIERECKNIKGFSLAKYQNIRE